MFKNGNILINGDRDTIVVFYEENKDDKECFIGKVIESTYYDKDDLDDVWLLDRFEIATVDNTPEEWHKYLIDKDREYSIRGSEKYKYSEEFCSKEFKIIKDLGDVCLVELMNVRTQIRAFIPKFDIKELNNCDELKEAKGSVPSQALSNILKEGN